MDVKGFPTAVTEGIWSSVAPVHSRQTRVIDCRKLGRLEVSELEAAVQMLTKSAKTWTIESFYNAW